MNRIKKLLISIIGIIIIIIIAIILILRLDRSNGIGSQGNTSLSNITNVSEYFNVKAIIESYSRNVNGGLKSSNLIKIFPTSVKEELSLDEENISQNIKFPNGIIRIDNLFVANQTSNILLYAANVTILNIDNEAKNEAKQIIVLADKANNSYYIIPPEYIEKKNIKISEGRKLSLYTEETIEANYTNSYSTFEITDDKICSEYFNTYINNMLYDVETAYNSLANEYRQQKYKSIEEYKNSISNTDIKALTLSNFLIDRQPDSTRYVCADQNKQYYVFTEKSIPMKATISLDSYTGNVSLRESQKVNLSVNEYFRIKNCVKIYLDTLNKNSSRFYDNVSNVGMTGYNLGKQKKAVINVLSESYKNNNKITEDNVEKFVEIFEGGKIFFPTEVELLKNNNIKSYKVKGVAKDLKQNKFIMIYCVLNISESRTLFSVEPLNEKRYNELTNVDMTDIKESAYNIYYDLEISKEKLCTEYLERYKVLSIANPQLTYNQMTEEYRNKRFGSLENYQSYIRDNLEELSGIKIYQYYVDDSTSQYVVKDQYENLYIFDNNNLLDYTVKLDTYTLEEQKFNTTYDYVTPFKKIQMNIDKFFQMINRHDYRTSYSVIADSFKQNSNMKTEEDFKKIAKQLFWDYNKIEFDDDAEEIGNNTYMYTIKLTDLTGKSSDTKNITVIMQLKENREFVMSFSQT